MDAGRRHHERATGKHPSSILRLFSLVTIDKSKSKAQNLIGKVVATWIAEEDAVTLKRLRFDRKRKIFKGVPDNIKEDNLPFDLKAEAG